MNGRWGRGTMRLASVPVDPAWGMRGDDESGFHDKGL
ncbi:hypothetical protein ABEH27_04050 [Pseudomonas sp. P39-UII1]